MALPVSKTLKTDSLKLVDMMWLDEEISSGSPMRRAWGEEEIFLDYWGRYDQVFDERPPGSISSSDLQQPKEDGTFLLLRSEHLNQIIASLSNHFDELSVMTKEQIRTLEQWKSLSLANHRYMVAYIFNRDDGDVPTTSGAGEHSQTPPVKGSKSEAGSGRNLEAATNRKQVVEVKVRRLQFILIILLGFIMIPLSLSLLIGELSKGAKLAPGVLIISTVLLMTYCAAAWLFRRGHVKAVKYFSDEGLVRNDGKTFAWADLSRVVDRVRFNRVTNLKGLWRTEIQFKNGESAWLLPTKISNFPEVYELVRGLPCEHTEVRA